jgi:anti-anti-sigma factor
MQIQVKEENGTKIIAVEGKIDTTTAPEFEKKLLEELATVKSLRIDLENVVYVSSAGLRAFLNGQKYANKNGVDMSIFNVADSVIEVFEMTGFIDILTVE